jgi:phytanoyl-CoA hydroxylase
MTYIPMAIPRPDRHSVKVEDYVSYQRTGFLKVPGLLSGQDTARMFGYAEDVLHGREEVPSVAPPPRGATLEQLMQRFVRIHMLHRTHAAAEWGLLHPRVLDVLEALIGPDVLALQSMLFFNPPGRGGQGWHQDSYYITTYPDTLIGAWIALEPADEDNGCLWVIPGSHCEPIYPPTSPHGLVHAQGAIEDLHPVENVSHLDDDVNALAAVARRYPPHVPVPMEPGDVLFFHAHLLHRSYPNRTVDRFRRSYVCHYCNARSWVPWNHGAPFEGEAANGLHILARGATHLPYARPAFGTPIDVAPAGGCPDEVPARMMGREDGDMEAVKA